MCLELWLLFAWSCVSVGVVWLLALCTWALISGGCRFVALHLMLWLFVFMSEFGLVCCNVLIFWLF